MSTRPIFLLSQPRAGSTLTQRVLAAHPRVSTASEPWVLLPVFYGLREEGVRAEYWHEAAAQAISDFTAELPEGAETYREEAAAMARRLYDAAADPGADYFLDKTPHYHLIASELIDTFEDARFIFLWRNPIAVLTSLLDSFRNGRWEPWLFRADIFDAITSLTAARKRAGDRAIAVRYEDLVAGEAPWERMFDFLDLEFEPDLMTEFREVELRGRYGDPGARGYDGVTDASVTRWRQSVANPVRRRWCARYLERIGAERLALMGYELDELLEQVTTTGNSRWTNTPLDLLHVGTSRLGERRRRRRLEGPDAPRPVIPAGRRTRLRRALHRVAAAVRRSRAGGRATSDDQMRSFWADRATENPLYYVDNRLAYSDPDASESWAHGEALLDLMLGSLGAELDGTEEVVEIGCGVGRMTHVLARRSRGVRALDISAEMLERARDHWPELDNVDWIQGDGTSLAPIGTASADACVSHVVFQHIPDPEVTLGYVREMGRVLRPGGWSAFQISNDPAIHRRRRGLEGLRILWRALTRRGPRGQAHPAWLGSSVELTALRAAADDSDMDVERVSGEGTQMCFVLLRRR